MGPTAPLSVPMSGPCAVSRAASGRQLVLCSMHVHSEFDVGRICKQLQLMLHTWYESFEALKLNSHGACSGATRVLVMLQSLGICCVLDV